VRGQITIPQAIRERWGLLSHTEVHVGEEGGMVFLEKDNGQFSRVQEAVRRLALSRGESEAGKQR
jgi:bifunctional DNA-binding transcriptional regulator/antitoxin component of YhaV-PrlF toxin-antitoxin module